MNRSSSQTFIDDVGRVVSSTDDEHEITRLVAKRLSDLLAGGYRLPPEVTRPSPVRHVTYPLDIAPDDSWSMASVVWDVGQRTPVHSHETWGVVGIYSGIEHEIRFLKPVAPTAGAAMTRAGEELWQPEQVTVCCTTDDDVHAVASATTVGIAASAWSRLLKRALAGRKQQQRDAAGAERDQPLAVSGERVGRNEHTRGEGVDARE